MFVQKEMPVRPPPEELEELDEDELEESRSQQPPRATRMATTVTARTAKYATRLMGHLPPKNRPKNGLLSTELNI